MFAAVDVFHSVEDTESLSSSCQTGGIKFDHHAAGALRSVDVGMGLARGLEQDALRIARKRAASTVFNEVTSKYDHKVGQPVVMTSKSSTGRVACFGEVEATNFNLSVTQ